MYKLQRPKSSIDAKIEEFIQENNNKKDEDFKEFILDKLFAW